LKPLPEPGACTILPLARVEEVEAMSIAGIELIGVTTIGCGV